MTKSNRGKKPRRVVLGEGLWGECGVLSPQAFRLKDSLGEIGIEISAVDILSIRGHRVRLVAEIL